MTKRLTFTELNDRQRKREELARQTKALRADLRRVIRDANRVLRKTRVR